MTWVALVGPEIEENLSLRYLASSLAAAGVRSEILPFHHDHHFAEVVRRILESEEPPVCVGLSLAFQWRALDMLAVAMALKDGGYRGHVTAGGHFATFAAREILLEFGELDSICRQESEETLVSLVAALVAGAPLDPIAGIAFRREDDVIFTEHPKLPELSTLPRPDWRGAPAACFGHAIAPIVGSRGCYANCTFCCIAAWHEQSLPGKRYRVREPDDVAAEMVDMQRERGVEVFVFHDDNFFLPSRAANLARFHALADALERRGIGRFGVVVKARPTDVHEDVFRVLRDRLHCIRCYVGVETDSEQGLITLRRWAKPTQNHHAIDVVRALDVYACCNLLVFDPDTTLASLEDNIAFMEWAGDVPFNFGRVELYAGTPLLHRMQAEGRARGDWLQHDYDLHDPDIDRVFRLALTAFRARNFAEGALANHIMGLRFDVEVARRFHEDLFDPAWLAEAKGLCAELSKDTVRGLRAIVARVRGTAATGSGVDGDKAFVTELAGTLRETERRIWRECRGLGAVMQARIGRGAPIVGQGDLVATPLQRGVLEGA